MGLLTRFSLLLASGSAEGEHATKASPFGQFLGLMILCSLVILFIVIFLNSAKKGLNTKFFGKLTTKLLEQLFVFVEGIAVGVIGAHGRKYIPMLMVLWMMIFVSNILAMVIHSSPTSDLSFNIALALIAVGYVQWEGGRAHGPLGHLKHFAGPNLPIGLAIFITPVIFLIEITSEAMKNVSLSLRLYGNIYGGGEAVKSINELGPQYGMAWMNFGDLLFPIKLLTAVVQALIFCLLFAVYLSLVTQPHDDHDEDNDHASQGKVASAH